MEQQKRYLHCNYFLNAENFVLRADLKSSDAIFVLQTRAKTQIKKHSQSAYK
jgi:hypothetical protein